jgi:hypothetical protein
MQSNDDDGVRPMDISEDDDVNPGNDGNGGGGGGGLQFQWMPNNDDVYIPFGGAGADQNGNGENGFVGLGLDPSEFVTQNDDMPTPNNFDVAPPEVINRRKFVYAKRGGNRRGNNGPPPPQPPQPQPPMGMGIQFQPQFENPNDNKFPGFGFKLNGGGDHANSNQQSSLLDQWASK